MASDFDCCHTTPMLMIAQGLRVRLDANGDAARITLMEPVVAH